ncbi:MAG: insulinase family protein [Deltaproteobacteria bacterium]|nr:insulinase family protein [Deltaproteobacteria bacterium]
MRRPWPLLPVTITCAIACTTGTTPIIVAPVVQPPVIAPPVAADPDLPLLPLDPKVRTGKLRNGLTYFITPSTDDGPTESTYFALAVNAGTLDETPRQKGAAHMLLHLAYPLVEEHVGDPEELGESVHDRTLFGFEQSVDGETTEETVRDRSLLLLRRIADGMKLDRTKLDGLREDLHGDFEEDPLPLEWRDTRLAEHRTYAPAEHYAALTDRDVMEYYRTWYRPDQMAVIVIGTSDPSGVVTAIERRFGGIPKPTRPAPAHAHLVTPKRDGLTLEVKADDSMQLDITHRTPHHRVRGERGYRGAMIDRLLGRVLANRWATITKREATVDHLAFTDDADLTRVALSSIDRQDLRRLLGELERLRVHGVTQSELDDTLQELGEDAADSMDLEWSTHAHALGAYFRDGRPYPSTAVTNVATRLATTIKLDEVNATAKATFGEVNRSIALQWPARETTGVTAPELREMSASAASTPIEKWDERPAVRPLFSPPPKPGTIVATKEIHGMTIWTLSNGARVIVRPTTMTRRDNLPAEIVGDRTSLRLIAVGPGGWSRLPQDAAIQARFAGDIILKSGVGDLAGAQLRDVLRERGVNLYVDIRPTNHELSATGSIVQLDAMFQLVHLELSRPRKDTEGFAAWKTGRKAELAVHPTSPYQAALEQLRAIEGNTPAPPATDAVIDAVDHDRALAAYRDHFGDIKHTTFLLVGSEANRPAVRTAVETYLASLGDMGTRITAKEKPVVAPRLTKPQKVLVPGRDHSMIVDYVADVGKGVQAERDLWIFAWALQHRLDLRLGKRPSVAVTAGLAENGRRFLRVAFTGRPTIGDHEKDVAAELELLRTKLVDPVVIDTVKARFMPRPVFVTAWTQAMVTAVGRGDDITARAAELTDHDGMTARVKPELIKATARRFGKPAAIVRFEPVP